MLAHVGGVAHGAGNKPVEIHRVGWTFLGLRRGRGQRSRSGFEHLDEGLLWNVNRAEGFHAFFTFLLLFEEFPFAGDIAP